MFNPFLGSHVHHLKILNRTLNIYICSKHMHTALLLVVKTETRQGITVRLPTAENKREGNVSDNTCRWDVDCTLAWMSDVYKNDIAKCET